MTNEVLLPDQEDSKQEKQSDPHKNRKIAEQTLGHFRYEGDDFWYEVVIGGPPIPYIVIGPGPQPNPRPIGTMFSSSEASTGSPPL